MSEFIEFLNTNQIFIMIILGSGGIFGLVINFWRLSADIKTKQSTLLNHYADKLTELYCDMSQPPPVDKLELQRKCGRFARDYMNVINHIAYLKSRNLINKNFIDYFNYSFAFGKILRRWMKEFGMDKDEFDHHYNHFNSWVLYGENIWDVPIEDLPDPLLELLDNNYFQGNPKNEYDRVKIYNKSDLIENIPEFWQADESK